MSGGSRPRAGRRARHRMTEEVPVLDVRRLHRDHLLDMGRAARVSWSDGTAIELLASSRSLNLAYSQRVQDGAAAEVRCEVLLTRSPCRYGGERPWFLCPECGNRVANLYLCGSPACRKCHGLVYRTQRISELARLGMRVRKLELRWANGAPSWYLQRPKGMQWTTWERRLATYIRARQSLDEAINTALMHLLGKD